LGVVLLALHVATNEDRSVGQRKGLARFGAAVEWDCDNPTGSERRVEAPFARVARNREIAAFIGIVLTDYVHAAAAINRKIHGSVRRDDPRETISGEILVEIAR
jgi:hypothetical protein